MKVKALKFTKKITDFTETQKWAIGRLSRKNANFTENVTAMKS